MIRNVVFDFGGVVVNYDPETYMRELYGGAPVGEYILKNLFGSELVRSLDLGLTTRAEAYAPVLERAELDGYGKQMRYVIDHWFDDMMGTREDTVELVKKLRRGGAHVYYLTNMPEDLWREFIARGLRDIFEGGVASFLVHMTKPDRRIYELLLREQGLKAGETVFFDDMERNIRGAEDVGIHGVLFTGAGEAEAELRRLGVLG